MTFNAVVFGGNLCFSLPTVLLVIACMLLHENVILTRCNAGLTINPKLEPFYKRKTPYCQVHGIVYTKLRITLIMYKKMLRLFQCTQFMQGYFIPIENYIALHQFDQVCKYIFSQYYSLFICSYLGSEINLFHVQKIKDGCLLLIYSYLMP